MLNSCCTSFYTPPGPSAPCVRAMRESDSQNLQGGPEILFLHMVEAQISLNSEETLNVTKGKWECPWLTTPPFWFDRLLTCRLYRLWSAYSTFSILVETLSTISWTLVMQDPGRSRGKGSRKVSHPIEMEQIFEIPYGEVRKCKHPSNPGWIYYPLLEIMLINIL